MSSYTRRDFLFITTAVAGATAVGATAWPFIAQLLPDDHLAQNTKIDIDLSQIAEGMAINIQWKKKPIVIMHRSKQEILAAKKTSLKDLKDQYARNANLPEDTLAYDNARSGGKDHEEWLILINICTHLGCTTKVRSGKYGGFFCPCHGSLYDLAGRIRSGPANKNLYIPPYQFLENNILRLG